MSVMKGFNMGSMNGTFDVGYLEENQGACSQRRKRVNFHLQFILFHGTPGDFKADGEERNPSSGKRFQIL